MNIYIGLLRGINVGGNNKLPMKELITLLQGLGLQQVKTYIQSGNVVFQSDRTDRNALASEITGAIDKRYGFAPQLFILTVDELQAAIAANPFPEGENEPKTLHLFFLDAAPVNPDWSKVEALRAPNERFALIDKVFYLHTPDGIGRSQLAEKFNRGWQVSITARNWRTVQEIAQMAVALAA